MRKRTPLRQLLDRQSRHHGEILYAKLIGLEPDGTGDYRVELLTTGKTVVASLATGITMQTGEVVTILDHSASGEAPGGGYSIIGRPSFGMRNQGPPNVTRAPYSPQVITSVSEHEVYVSDMFTVTVTGFNLSTPPLTPAGFTRISVSNDGTEMLISFTAPSSPGLFDLEWADGYIAKEVITVALGGPSARFIGVAYDAFGALEDSAMYSSLGADSTWLLSDLPIDIGALHAACGGATIIAVGQWENRILRSVDGGVIWTPITAPEMNSWISVATDGNGVWCAVSGGGTNRVMRSADDGLTWASVLVTANPWAGIAYGNGVWVVVATSGTQRIMRSTDGGLTWSYIVAPEANQWKAVATDGSGIWIAVATSGTNRTMRSTNDGVTWAVVAAAEANSWEEITYGAGAWVAVASTGTNQVMRTIDDGVSWSPIAATESTSWSSVAYGAGIWIAGSTASINRIMRSTNGGVSWTSVTVPTSRDWYALTYLPGA